jgi:hypothetical protein
MLATKLMRTAIRKAQNHQAQNMTRAISSMALFSECAILGWIYFGLDLFWVGSIFGIGLDVFWECFILGMFYFGLNIYQVKTVQTHISLGNRHEVLHEQGNPH